MTVSARTLGLVTAGLGLAVDQISKLWLVYGYGLAENGPVRLAPFAEFRLVWNYGISYGLFQQDNPWGRWVLVALALVASVVMTVWLWRSTSTLLALSLGLLIGGAIGNAIDRAWAGAVVDFVHLFLPDRSRSWYVFNAADVWIVAGVVGLLIDAFRSGPEDATKSGSS